VKAFKDNSDILNEIVENIREVRSERFNFYSYE